MYSAAAAASSPPRRDFISVTLSPEEAVGVGGYNNSKAWRRRSCWRKWKQLSRLQRSIILFVFAFLAICGVISYTSMGEPWKSLTSKQLDEQRMEPEIPGLKLANPAVLPAPQKADANLGDYPELSPQKPPKPPHVRRGPPNLQIKPPWRDVRPKTRHDTSSVGQELVQADQNEKTEKSVISWRGAVIETDQSTEPPSSKMKEPEKPTSVEAEDQKEPVPINDRQLAVIEAFRHAWKGYKEFSWGHDELKPLSKSYNEWFGLGLTLIDALDTMWILGLKEEFGVHLAELTVDPQGALAIRQLASVILKQYVETHWCSQSEKFRPPETTERAKVAIRELLPNGLRESISKVRSSVAYAVSAIAHWDWPEAWPELFNLLMEMLVSGDVNAVHGAMRVLTEFTREVTDTQMPLVAPVILPEMYKIFTMAEVYGIRTRSRAVEIFTTCAHMICNMEELEKGAAKVLIFPVVQQFTEAFVQALQMPDGPTSDSGFKMEVLKAVTALVKNYPKHMVSSMQQILPIVWNTLTESAAFYVRTEVNYTEEVEDPVDSDGEVLGFENLVFSIFEFVHALLENNKFKSTVKKALPELIYYILLYMQITEEQIKVWTANPQQFVEDEDDDTFSYTVRIAAQDLLLAVAADFQNESATALAAAATRHLQEAEQAKNNGAEHWWKIHEACMLALGSVKSIITDSVKNGRIHFDMHGFLTNVVLADLNLSVSPFLLGRALWAASRFTVAMSPELIQQFLQATVSGLHETQPPSVRISAVRAIWGYCDQLKISESTHVLQPFLPSILDGLIHLATQFSSEVLNLVMETLCIVCTVDPAFTASVENKICPFTIAIFLKYSNDPVVASLAQDIFKELAQIEACQGPMQMRLIPTLVSIMQAPADKIPAGLCATSIDILTTVVRNTKPPLSQLLICQAFPAVAQCSLNTDDNATMQNGGECLRAYVSVALEQIAQWHDEQGHNGLWYVMQVVSQLLDPRTSEFTAAFVGRLVSTLISKAGSELGENLDQILRAILSKMQQAETLSVMQSLIMVFAHLVHSQLEPLLEFLCSLPGPTGKPALEFVMAEWMSRQHLFYGQYEGKVSSVALCKLLQYGINTDDKRLQDIRVKGEEIFNMDEGIRTRSKSAKNPERWTNIPLLVKILKLIINELSNAMEANASRQTTADWSQDDLNDMWEDQDEDEDEDEGLAGQFLSDILSTNKYDEDYYEDDEEDDPDALKDPLYQIDLQAYLTDFLCQFAQQPCYAMFSDHLNENEKRVLQAIGI